jgi:hypothetical protein
VAALVAAVVLVGGLLVALPLVVDTPRVRAFIAATASQTLGRPVKFRSVALRVLPLPSVELKGLEVAEDPKFGATPFLTLDRGLLRLRLWPLLTGRVEFGELVLEEPLISLVQAPDGRWNVASLGTVRETPTPPRPGGAPEPRGGGEAGVPILATRVRLEKGVVTYSAASGQASTTRYRVDDLDLTLTGEGGNVTFRGRAVVKPGDLAVEISDGRAAVAGVRRLLDAPVRARLALEAKDVSRLVAAAAGPAPAVAGGLKGDLSLGGTLGAPTASGDLVLSKLTVTHVNPRCPPPRERSLGFGTLKVGARYADGRLSGHPVTTAVANAPIATNLTVTLDHGLRVELADLDVQRLPLHVVLVDFLCQGYAVTGSLDLTGALALRPAEIWTSLAGDGRVSIGRGKVVGSRALALLGDVTRVGGALSSLLRSDAPGSLTGSPLEFESITATYRIRNGVVTTRDLIYTSTAMRVTAAGDYVLATGGLNMDVVVRYARGTVQAKVTGTAASPSIRVLPASALRSVDPQRVERGLQDLLKRFR